MHFVVRTASTYCSSQCKESLSFEGAQPKKLNDLLRAFELAEVSRPGITEKLISGVIQRTTMLVTILVEFIISCFLTGHDFSRFGIVTNSVINRP